MQLVGGLFADNQSLADALEALDKKGFRTFTVFGPDELFREPVESPEVEERLESQHQTAMGTIGGISVNPRPYAVEDPDARPVTEELMDMGMSEEEANFFVAGLHQNRLLLLVRVKAGRAEEAREVLEEQGSTISEE
jgi:hypothetical protein